VTAAAPPTDPAAALRRALGDRYAVERELGRGGMGAVYLARDLRLDRPVALKVLPPEYATQAALRDRFVRETRTAAGFSHPNIVPVYAVEESDELLAYAMGFVEGETLTERVGRLGPLPAREIVRVLQDVGYALAYAHGRGVVHRDVKPDNVMLERATGRALVMDFGIARSMAAPAAAAGGLTRVGEVVGTPEYMSPEQAAGDVVDGRSDIYALGLTAHFAATGRVAITGDTTQRILARQLTEPVPPLASARPDLPPALAEAIDRCVAKEPADRFPTAEALVEAIDAARLAEPEIPLPIRLFAGELGTLSMVTAFALLVTTLFLRYAARIELGIADVVLMLVLLGAVLLTRALTTLSEARRLAVAGFGVGEVMDGLARVVAERASRREELRADPETRRRRARTVRWAAAMLAMSVALIWGALRTRVRIPDGYRTPFPGFVLIVSGAWLLGVSVVLLLRNPFRMPPGERLFRLVWLGPLGRGFLRVAARRVRAGAGGSARRLSSAAHEAVVRRPPAPAAPPATARRPDDRLASLEARVAALERWRDGG
jgi:serine/threonine-protein kinase